MTFDDLQKKIGEAVWKRGIYADTEAEELLRIYCKQNGLNRSDFLLKVDNWCGKPDFVLTENPRYVIYDDEKQQFLRDDGGWTGNPEYAKAYTEKPDDPRAHRIRQELVFTLEKE